MSPESTVDLDKLRGLINAAQHIVVFTGGGISTESGIDLRIPGTELWRGEPIKFEDYVASESVRQEMWRRASG